jgi:flagellar motility protein MotE (MotC chaperone)
MIGYFRDLRLIPIAMVASACLLVLVAADLLLGRVSSSDGDPPRVKDATVIHATPAALRPKDDKRPDDKRPDDKRFGDRRGDDKRADEKRADDRRTDDKRPDDKRSDDKRSWAQQMFNFPGAKTPPRERDDLSLLPAIAPLSGDRTRPDVTGALSAPATPAANNEKNEPSKNEANEIVEAAAQQAGQGTDKSDAGKDGGKSVSAKAPQDPPPAPSGKVIPVDANASTSAAERAILERLQQRRQELEKRARELDIREGLIADAERRVESKLMQVKEGQQQLATAVQKKDEAEAARFKGLVTMYENMKPRDAAKIFDRLDVNVLLQVASMMSPRAMSEILALMSPDRAQQLTVELANRAQASPKTPGANLPKIEGRPTGP